VHADRTRRARLGSELAHALVQAHEQIHPVHVMEAGAVLGRGVVIDRSPRHGAVGQDLARRLEDRRAAAVERTVRTLGIAAVEIDAEPLLDEPRAVRRDVEPCARGARRRRLLVDVDRGEDARLAKRQRRAETAHSRTDDDRAHDDS
jgi:hypothetical protein